MNKKLGWKVIVIVATLLVFVVGIFVGSDPDKSFPALKRGDLLGAFKQNIHLGLDLQGGVHMVLQVKVNDAIYAESQQAAARMKDALAKANIAYTEVDDPDKDSSPDKIAVKGLSPSAISDVNNIVKERFADFDGQPVGDGYVLTLKQQASAKLKEDSVDKAVETIRGRIDELGVSEPIIQRHGLGQYQIVVELPGVSEGDKARIVDIMKTTAMLQIRQVLDGGKSYPSEQEALAAHGGVKPDGAEILPGTRTGRSGGSSDEAEQYFLVSAASAVSGGDLRDARQSRDENNQPAVSFTLNNDGGKRFQEFTRAHIGDYLAVVLDGRVREVATIRSEIRDSGQISGSMDEQQAHDLALKLRSGALPASIEILSDSTVGPSLGADSIRKGVNASIAGLAAVLIFMLVYYKGSGVNADLALILNLVILLGFMGFFGATLTLPGIAGLILTVGMGVDSNVLIFERIREELRNGKAAPAAVEQGFGHAFKTIIDTHVTTIVSAAILFFFGTGPVKGFAVTLVFGLLANLFTAVFVSRVIFDWHLRNHKHGEALSI